MIRVQTDNGSWNMCLASDVKGLSFPPPLTAPLSSSKALQACHNTDYAWVNTARVSLSDNGKHPPGGN